FQPGTGSSWGEYLVGLVVAALVVLVAAVGILSLRQARERTTGAIEAPTASGSGTGDERRDLNRPGRLGRPVCHRGLRPGGQTQPGGHLDECQPDVGGRGPGAGGLFAFQPGAWPPSRWAGVRRPGGDDVDGRTRARARPGPGRP